MEVRRCPLVGAPGVQPELLPPGACPSGHPASGWTGRCQTGTRSTVVIFPFLASQAGFSRNRKLCVFTGKGFDCRAPLLCSRGADFYRHSLCFAGWGVAALGRHRPPESHWLSPWAWATCSLVQLYSGSFVHTANNTSQ